MESGASTGTENKTIAFFDFDGTITNRDSMIEFLKFLKGRRVFYAGMAYLLPTLVALKLKLISNHRAKERMLTHFLGGMDETVFNAHCKRFSNTVLPTIIREKAMEKIRELQTQGTHINIVSASARNWVSDWCDSNGFHLIATELEVINGKISGKILGKNCHGIEKTCRIQTLYNLSEYSEIHCFGDTSGDKPMLALGTHQYFKPFR